MPLSNEEIQERRLRLQRNYKMTMLFSFFAKLVAFFLIPVKFEALYCGMGIIAFDVVLAIYYGRSLKELNRKEMEQAGARNTMTTTQTSQLTMPPSYEESNIYHISRPQQLPYSTTQQPWNNNMFCDIGVVDSSDLVLMGPIANRIHGTPSQKNYVVEMPPSYDDAVKNTG